jgi:chromosome partitioning protein
LDDIAAWEEQARRIWQGLGADAVLNAADPGSSSANPDAAAALADFPGMELVDARVRRHKALANATDLGLLVEELAPPGPPACSEIAMLVMFLMAVRGWRYPKQRRCCDDRIPSKPSRIGKKSHGNT